MVAPVSVDALKGLAARDPKGAVRETAKQFEAMFMQQLLKSMREATATMSSGLMEGEGTKLGRELLDSQYAVKMSGLPGGLTEAIARQLERQMGSHDAAADAGKRTLASPRQGGVSGSGKGPAAAAATGADAVAPLSQRQVDFVRQHGDAARAAEAQTGIPAAYMIGQAAHETGWGRSEIRNADGSDSHNLFGIKATGGWTGKVAEITTTEYVNGQPQKVTAKFRAYASFEEAFRDYARMLSQSPRYADVAAQAAAAPASAASASSFARGLQDAGYATDPAYASKLARVINRTLQAQRLT